MGEDKQPGKEETLNSAILELEDMSGRLNRLVYGGGAQGKSPKDELAKDKISDARDRIVEVNKVLLAVGDRLEVIGE